MFRKVLLRWRTRQLFGRVHWRWGTRQGFCMRRRWTKVPKGWGKLLVRRGGSVVLSLGSFGLMYIVV